MRAAAVEIAAGYGRDRRLCSDRVDARVLIPELAFKPKPAEIVTDDGINVVTGAEIDDVGVVDIRRRRKRTVRVVEVHVLNDHSAALEARVERVVPSNGWGRHSR